eukprot:2928411-Lingulodinium_polyedra.AAC.1
MSRGLEGASSLHGTMAQTSRKHIVKQKQTIPERCAITRIGSDPGIEQYPRQTRCYANENMVGNWHGFIRDATGARL